MNAYDHESRIKIKKTHGCIHHTQPITYNALGHLGYEKAGWEGGMKFTREWSKQNVLIFRARSVRRYIYIYIYIDDIGCPCSPQAKQKEVVRSWKGRGLG